MNSPINPIVLIMLPIIVGFMLPILDITRPYCRLSVNKIGPREKKL
jgi:hypothetical protein